MIAQRLPLISPLVRLTKPRFRHKGIILGYFTFAYPTAACLRVFVGSLLSSRPAENDVLCQVLQPLA